MKKLLQGERSRKTEECKLGHEDTSQVNFTEITQLAQLWRDDLAHVLESRKILANIRIVRLEDILAEGFLKSLESFIQMPLKGLTFLGQTC